MTDSRIRYAIRSIVVGAYAGSLDRYIDIQRLSSHAFGIGYLIQKGVIGLIITAAAAVAWHYTTSPKGADMTENTDQPTADEQVPDPTVLPDAPGDGERGDDVTDTDVPDPAGPATDSDDAPAPVDNGEARPDPCEAEGES